MKDKSNRHGTVGKSSSEHNIFVNPPPVPLFCEMSGALHLVLRQAGKQNTGEL